MDNQSKYFEEFKAISGLYDNHKAELAALKEKKVDELIKNVLFPSFKEEYFAGYKTFTKTELLKHFPFAKEIAAECLSMTAVVLESSGFRVFYIKDRSVDGNDLIAVVWGKDITEQMITGISYRVKK